MKPSSRHSTGHRNSLRVGDDFIKNLLKRYRITTIDKHSCKLVSRRTNMTWKIEIFPPTTLKA